MAYRQSLFLIPADIPDKSFTHFDWNLKAEHDQQASVLTKETPLKLLIDHSRPVPDIIKRKRVYIFLDGWLKCFSNSYSIQNFKTDYNKVTVLGSHIISGE